MNRIDLSNLRLLSKGEGLRVYELVDDYVNFVDAEVSCGYPSSGGDGMELVKVLELWDRKKEALRKKWDDMKEMSRGVEFRKRVLDRMR
jgi:hypothetical protein